MRTSGVVVTLFAAVLGLAAPGHGGLWSRVDAKDVPVMETETDPKYKLPDGFLFGAGTGAYQTEGAWDADGKGVSVFDHGYHKQNTTNATNGDIAADSYNRWEEDLDLAKELNLDVYRISISWTRIFPNGDMTKPRNEKGVQYYHKVIDGIIKRGMIPMVTIYHFDHPQTFEDTFGGWLSEQMIDIFVKFAEVIFDEYGDQVKHWVTINEPNMHCMMLYGIGSLPPINTTNFGDESVYKCIHHEILAHSAAYRLYREKFLEKQNGTIGIGALSFYSRPNSTEYDDISAANRANMFDVSLLLHPLVYGDYPAIVRDTLEAKGRGDILPRFTEQQQKDLVKTFDFVGLNTYFGQTVADARKQTAPGGNSWKFPGPRTDANVTIIEKSVGGGAGAFGDDTTFRQVNEWVLRDIPLWIKAHYGPQVGIFVTENGLGGSESSIDDWDSRAKYHSVYLRELMRTINEDQVNVIGYTVWSFLDDFEWSGGLYTRRFGMVHVDYEGGSLNRTLKRSQYFFKKMMADRSVPVVKSSASGIHAISILIGFAATLCLSKLL